MFDAEFTNKGQERNVEKMRVSESGSTPQQSVFVEEQNPADDLLVPKKKKAQHMFGIILDFGFRPSSVTNLHEGTAK